MDFILSGVRLETAANKQDHGYRQEYENGLGRLKLGNVKLDIVEQDRTSFGCTSLGLARRSLGSVHMVIHGHPDRGHGPHKPRAIGGLVNSYGLITQRSVWSTFQSHTSP